MWGKSFNAGQTCVAPDYVLLPKDKLIEFTRAARAAVTGYFPNGIDNGDYSSIINQNHCERVQGLIDDAKEQGVNVLELAPKAETNNKIPPTLVLEPNENCRIFNEEIFGPVLPVFTYENLDDALQQINHHRDPLALYVFSSVSDEVEYVTRHVRAGSVAVNDTLLQYIQNDLPFGGVGNSGLGKYHGIEGFQTFSSKQARFTQRGIGNFTSIKLLYPPYTGFSRFMMKLIRFMP